MQQKMPYYRIHFRMKRLRVPNRRLACPALLTLVLWTALFLLTGEGSVAVSVTAESRSVPILMYHSILKDPARQGKFVVSPDVLSADLAYLSSHGYETVFLSELAAFVHDDAPLPEKPVLITLDDGYYNTLTYVLPLLEQYDMKAVVSVVGSYAQRYTDSIDPNPNYGYLNWAEIRALSESGRIEIQNHTYDMHAQSGRQGCMRKFGERPDAYRAALSDDLTKLQKMLGTECGITPIAFTYPFGQITPESLEIIRELGFLATLTCFERQNVIVRGRSETLYGLGRYNRPAGESTEAFMARALSGQ